ncbi:hypothetical protein BD779DRAFT_1476833 [Infundibulicybe gibba]|nr:hypothetical protein BD779DRAFT_1476833 [Infundibulicybe gibba]
MTASPSFAATAVGISGESDASADAAKQTITPATMATMSSTQHCCVLLMYTACGHPHEVIVVPKTGAELHGKRVRGRANEAWPSQRRWQGILHSWSDREDSSNDGHAGGPGVRAQGRANRHSVAGQEEQIWAHPGQALAVPAPRTSLQRSLPPALVGSNPSLRRLTPSILACSESATPSPAPLLLCFKTGENSPSTLGSMASKVSKGDNSSHTPSTPDQQSALPIGEKPSMVSERESSSTRGAGEGDELGDLQSRFRKESGPSSNNVSLPDQRNQDSSGNRNNITGRDEHQEKRGAWRTTGSKGDQRKKVDEGWGTERTVLKPRPKAPDGVYLVVLFLEPNAVLVLLQCCTNSVVAGKLNHQPGEIIFQNGRLGRSATPDLQGQATFSIRGYHSRRSIASLALPPSSPTQYGATVPLDSPQTVCDMRRMRTQQIEPPARWTGTSVPLYVPG